MTRGWHEIYHVKLQTLAQHRTERVGKVVALERNTYKPSQVHTIMLHQHAHAHYCCHTSQCHDEKMLQASISHTGICLMMIP